MKLIKIHPQHNYILKAGRVIDGDGTLLPANTIHIEGGRIARLYRAGDHLCGHPEQPAVTLDLADFTVLPPLVDCHVHLALDGEDFAAARRRWEQPAALDGQVRASLADTLRHGILAVRDGGDRAGIAIRYRDLLKEEDAAAPVIRAPGFALRGPGTYGSFLGPGVDLAQPGPVLDGLVHRGADLVKVLLSGVVSFKEYGRVGPVQCTAGALSAIVRGARARGLTVMAHASSDAAVRLAAEAGVDSVEHGYFLSRETLVRLARQGTAWVPTVVPVAARLNCPAEEGGPDSAERLVVERTVERQLKMIKEAANLGITLGVGTDAGATGVRHGAGYREELALYQRAGLAAADIIRCATANGARILGLDWGKLAPGQTAALIAVKGDPLREITSLCDVRYALLPAEKPL